MPLVDQPLAEIRKLGYQGSSNLLVPPLTPQSSPAPPHKLSQPKQRSATDRRAVERRVCRDDRADQPDHQLRCTPAPCRGDDTQLDAWTSAAREADLPNVHSLSRGYARIKPGRVPSKLFMTIRTIGRQRVQAGSHSKCREISTIAF